MQKIIFYNSQSPGDIVMMTAAIRDLHRINPHKFQTDVRTSCDDLWLNNPYLTSIADSEEGVSHFKCEYPLIHLSNTLPYHFIHGFSNFISNQLGLNIYPTEFRGDIHLSETEKNAGCLVYDEFKSEIPFWIICAGGKTDFTVKWWDIRRYQSVVDHFLGRIQFVQIGRQRDFHPKLNNVLDLRGKTSIRDLVKLVYHAGGVICPVTFLMHLSAAVEIKKDVAQNRICIVIAGGRESTHWEAYSHHQYLHTIGMLPCCKFGGCWKSRTTALYDGVKWDLPEHRCTDVVKSSSPRVDKVNISRKPDRELYIDVDTDALPHCMDMITAFDVITKIEMAIG